MKARIAVAIVLGVSGVALAEEQPRTVRLYAPRELVERVHRGQPTVFLDVREPQEFTQDHVPGALNMPEREFEARQGELPQDALIIPYCNMDFRGFLATRRLRALGFIVGLMQPHGLVGWGEAGLPVAGRKTGLTEAQALAKLATVDLAVLPGASPAARVARTGQVRTFDLVAAPWYFDPNDLEVNAGDEVHLRLTSQHGSHWFVLPDFEVASQLPEGQTQELVFLADRRGDFRFGACEWTGAGLQVMKGRLRVD